MSLKVSVPDDAAPYNLTIHLSLHGLCRYPQDFLRLNPGNKTSADATLARHEKKLLESEKQVLEVLRRADESNTRGIDWLEFR